MGNFYGQAAILRDDFQANLLARDYRLTKSAPNLFKDLDEDKRKLNLYSTEFFSNTNIKSFMLKKITRNFDGKLSLFLNKEI